MKPKVKLIVGGVILAGLALIALQLPQRSLWVWEELVFWLALALASERFWVRTAGGDSAHSLAVTVKLAVLVILPPAASLLVVFLSTTLGDLLFRRSPWYRALYNGSQLLVAAAAAMMVYRSLGGVTFPEIFGAGPYLWHPAGIRDRLPELFGPTGFWVAILLLGTAYILVNTFVMSWLMGSMTDRNIARVWRSHVLVREEIQGSLTVVLLTPLFLLLYGLLGILGVALLFGCLFLVHLAGKHYLALQNTQDTLIRSERMAAMGDMAEEIGRDMGNHLGELRSRGLALVAQAGVLGNETFLKHARIIETNTEKMTRLVEGLIAFSHRDAERVESDLNDLVRTTIDFIRPQNRFDGIEFSLVLDPVLPRIPVDPAQIQQVLLNLFANAADALGETGSPRRHITVETRFDGHDHRIRLAVRDNGPGIPEEHLHRVFEPHFTTKTSGHGYGLSLVFRIATNHRGVVTATNDPAGGARFELVLPAA